MLVADIVERGPEGVFVAAPAEGETARILIRPSKNKRERGPAPSLGARVLVRVAFDENSGAYSGRIVKILDKSAGRPLGVYHALESGGGRVQPVEKRAAGRDYFVPAGLEGGARDGELVALGAAARRRLPLPSARVVEPLGAVDTERAISRIAIDTHGMPDAFSASRARRSRSGAAGDDGASRGLARAAARHHRPARRQGPRRRRPRRGARRTAALSSPSPSPTSRTYVQPGLALDREALERGNSVYFPDRVVPMLPERISNDLCSLRPNEDRPALAVRLVLGADGRKTSHSFHRIMMRSAAKLTYEQAQPAIDGRPDETTEPLLESVLRPFWAAY